MNRLPIPKWMLPILRVSLLAVGAYFAFRLLEPRGYGWTVGVFVAALGLLFGYFVWRRRSRIKADEARSDAWAEAMMNPAKRGAVVASLRAEIALADPLKEADAHARLSLMCAEVLEADGDASGARAVLDAVQPSELEPDFAGVIRHARAVAALSDGDLDAADAALDSIGGPVGDRTVDLRVRILRGALAAERGKAAEALQVAEDAMDEAGSDKDLLAEARVLKAIAQEAGGDAEAALMTLRRLGDDMLEVLKRLGLPRARELATKTLERMAEDEAGSPTVRGAAEA
ncbi:MAG: tetratricopeptide repeat protein [Sandaracinaceae bacterium]